MIELFSGKTSKDVEVCFAGGVLTCTSKLEEGIHTYIYSDFILLDDLNFDVNDCFVFLRARSNISLTAVLVFFDSNRAKLTGGSSPANQSGKIDVPNEAVYLKIALRFMQVGVAEIYSFDVGSLSEINKVVAQCNSFNYKELKFLTDNYRAKVSLAVPLVVVETVFCDTETDLDILSRYLSYFVGLITCVSSQNYSNFIWFVHVSSDKGHAIDLIRATVERVGLGGKVYVNIYSHPKDGYGNENEVHIDRLRRPNSIFPELRDKLFSAALEKSGFYKSEELDKCVVARLALDDDDFITAHHFDSVQSLALECSKEIDEKLSTVLIGLKRIFVSHFLPDGKVEVADVEFSRAMTGCKFSVSIGDYPRSAFSITERFDEVDKDRADVKYFEFDGNKPSFSYNRHGNNFSGQNKSFYYKKEYGVSMYSSHSDMLNDFSKL
ncbi:hypothetical protein [Pseudomonas sivasensis]|uniref:Uncharacterized protein n=1 Tax=Pseudomonas sivasensis TaxID=1880678 RepID=A0ABW8DXS7_9PSED